MIQTLKTQSRTIKNTTMSSDNNKHNKKTNWLIHKSILAPYIALYVIKRPKKKKKKKSCVIIGVRHVGQVDHYGRGGHHSSRLKGKKKNNKILTSKYYSAHIQSHFRTEQSRTTFVSAWLDEEERSKSPEEAHDFRSPLPATASAGEFNWWWRWEN